MEHLPYLYKYNVAYDECQEICATAVWCPAFAMSGTQCALYLVLAAAWTVNVPNGFSRMAVSDESVVGALEDLNQVSTCYITSFGSVLAENEYLYQVGAPAHGARRLLGTLHSALPLLWPCQPVMCSKGGRRLAGTFPEHRQKRLLAVGKAVVRQVLAVANGRAKWVQSRVV